MSKQKKPIQLSVVIATHNEEANLEATLAAVHSLADEILVADGESTDRTVEIAKKYGALVLHMTNKRMFHFNKQEAGEKAKGEWILYLDADEIVTPELANEIRAVLNEKQEAIQLYDHRHFLAHMQAIGARDGIVFDTTPPIHGYFIARKNFFLGRYLLHSGVYPDGVIRLVKNGKGYWPCKDVHETMVVEGNVSWLKEPMIHMADPTFARYLQRANRYTTLTALNMQKKRISKGIGGIINYVVWLPLKTFFLIFIRHRGYLDGFSGFVWALMSGLHFPIAYLKYLEIVR